MEAVAQKDEKYIFELNHEEDKPDGHIKMIKTRFIESPVFLTIFSSLAGGLRRKKQRGAKRISMIPIIVMSHGKPIAFAIAPPAEGPFGKQRIR